MMCAPSTFLLGFGLGPLELTVFLVIALLLFGNRLPSVMRSMGQGITEFKKGVKEGDEPPKSRIGQDQED